METKQKSRLTDIERAARWKAFWTWALQEAFRMIEEEDAAELAA